MNPTTDQYHDSLARLTDSVSHNLPMTGLDLLVIALVALALVAAGIVMHRAVARSQNV